MKLILKQKSIKPQNLARTSIAVCALLALAAFSGCKQSASSGDPDDSGKITAAMVRTFYADHGAEYKPKLVTEDFSLKTTPFTVSPDFSENDQYYAAFNTDRDRCSYVSMEMHGWDADFNFMVTPVRPTAFTYEDIGKFYSCENAILFDQADIDVVSGLFDAGRTDVHTQIAEFLEKRLEPSSSYFQIASVYQYSEYLAEISENELYETLVKSYTERPTEEIPAYWVYAAEFGTCFHTTEQYQISRFGDHTKEEIALAKVLSLRNEEDRTPLESAFAAWVLGDEASLADIENSEALLADESASVSTSGSGGTQSNISYLPLSPEGFLTTIRSALDGEIEAGVVSYRYKPLEDLDLF